MSAAIGDGGPQAEPLRVLAWAHVAWLLWGLGMLAVTAVFLVTTWPMYDAGYIEAHGEPLPDFILMFVLNACVARWLATRRRWVVCAVVSALNWIAIPWGPVLGTCTLIVLNKDGVRASFR